MHGEISVRMVFPGKSRAKKVIHRTHEINLNFCLQLVFECRFHQWVHGIVDEVVDIDPYVDHRLFGRIWISGEVAREEARIVDGLLKAHVAKGLAKHIIPVVGTAPKAV